MGDCAAIATDEMIRALRYKLRPGPPLGAFNMPLARDESSGTAHAQ
jgi:hypothetical protein